MSGGLFRERTHVRPPLPYHPPVCGRAAKIFQAFQIVHESGFQAPARDWILRLVCFDFRSRMRRPDLES